MKRAGYLLILLVGVGLGLVFSFRSGAGQSDAAKQPSSETAQRPFGLAGDGLTDDTERLERAVNDGVGSLHLPRGNYRITRPIVVDLDRAGVTSFTSDGTARIVMAGPGPALRFVGTHAGTADPKTVRSNVWERERTPMVDRIEIVGDHEEADGIEAEGTMQLTVSGVVLRRLRHGIRLVKRNRNVIISACHIYENRGVGVYYDQVNLHQSNIVGCHISYCDGGGVVVRGGDVRNVHIGACDIEGCMSADGPSTANILFDSAGGSLAEAAITGCTIQHGEKGNEGANIRILGLGSNANRPAAAPQWGHITISGNVLSDVQHNIDIDNARGVTIVGNTFWMAYQHNLRVANSQQIVLGANVFERNPAYAYGTSLDCRNAILFRDCRDCTLNGLHVHHVYKSDAAVTLENCRRFNMTGCSIVDSEGIGLLWKNVSDSRLSDCHIVSDLPRDKTRPSLRVVGGSGNQIANNLLDAPFEIPEASATLTGNESSR